MSLPKIGSCSPKELVQEAQRRVPARHFTVGDEQPDDDGRAGRGGTPGMRAATSPGMPMNRGGPEEPVCSASTRGPLAKWCATIPAAHRMPAEMANTAMNKKTLAERMTRKTLA